MKKIEVINIMKKEIEKAGYRYKTNDSKTTDSFYFIIFSTHSKLYFRVSDHSTYKNVLTFRVDKKTDYKTVVSFIKKRISDVGRRNVYSFLGV